MIKLLINCPDGEQKIECIHESGGYFDKSAVIWDERSDGTLPDITIGAMVRYGDTLVFDQARKDQHNAAVAAIIEKQENEKAKLELIDIDLRTIAALREAEAARPGASNTIKELENEAAAARAKIK